MEAQEVKTNTMTRHQSLVMYGIIIVITGIIISSLAYNPSRVIQYIVATGLFLSAVFAFLTSYKSKSHSVQLKYHAFQGAGLLAYALTILIYANTLERFLNATVYFLLYFGVTEIMAALQLLTLSQKMNLRLIIFRAVVGFLTALGAILIMTTSYVNQNNALLGSGFAFIFGGTGFILFANLLRKFETRSVPA
jgi:uncharacterized membrane protein HdeD (DUF308 family)